MAAEVTGDILPGGYDGKAPNRRVVDDPDRPTCEELA
jgi:hypothetical protein